MTESSVRPDAPFQLLLDGTAVEPHLSTGELVALIEALLLVAPEPPTVDDIATAAAVPAERVERALRDLTARSDRGWIVQRQGDHLHLASAPRFAAQVSRFLGLEREARLSPAALETLAIVAYQQPVTRAAIEAVRGVDCAGVIATLHARELIEPVGRLQAVGNPYQYGTTIGFLKLFGLTSLDDLPPLGSIDGQDGLALLTSSVAATDHGDEDQVIQIS